MSENIFEGAEIIHAYSRAQAIADGVLVDVSAGDTAPLVREVGIAWPLALTAAAWHATVGLGGTWKPDPANHGQEVLQLPECQDPIGRTWDVLWMLRLAVLRLAQGTDTVCFEVRVWDGRRVHVVKLKAVVGPGDAGEPVITIMLPNED
jgi:hypothetical protein